MKNERQEFYNVHSKIKEWFYCEVRKKVKEFYKNNHYNQKMFFKDGSFINIRYNDFGTGFYYYDNCDLFDHVCKRISNLDVETLNLILKKIELEIEQNKEECISQST